MMLSNRIKYSLLALVISAGVLLVPALTAQEETEAENTEETTSTTETLRERIEKIVEQQKDNVESVLGEITDNRRGFIGQVTRVSQEILTVESGGATKVVSLSNVALMEEGKEIETDVIAVDDWVVVLGLITDNNFTPKKINLLSKSPRPDTQVVYLGALKNIKLRSIDFQTRGQEEVITVSISANTDYQDRVGEEAELASFIEDDQVLLVGYMDDEDIIVTVIRALAPFDKGE